MTNWEQKIREFCLKYNIPLEYLPELLMDPKVLPMIRGKAFEYSALLKFRECLDSRQWDVQKLTINPQFGLHDQDVTISHFETGINIKLECKLSAKGKKRVLSDKNKEFYGLDKNCSYFQIDIKCMRSRTLGEQRVNILAPILGVSETTLKVHNDQYVPTDFDVVVTSISNAFYVTDPQTGLYEWKPDKTAIKFLKTLASKSEFVYEDLSELKDFAFNCVYIARSDNLAVSVENGVKCSRKKCLDRDNCGFIPNYPKITFDLSTGEPLPPWFEIENCNRVLDSFLPSRDA